MGETAELRGLVPTSEEDRLEDMLLRGKTGVTISGVDENGGMILVKIARGGKLKQLLYKTKVGSGYYVYD